MSAKLDLNSPWIVDNPWALVHGDWGIRMVNAFQKKGTIWSYQVPNDPQLYGNVRAGEMVEVQIDPSGLREPEHFKKKYFKSGVQVARRELSARVAEVAGRRGLKGVRNSAVLFGDSRLAEYLAQTGGQIEEDVRGEFYIVRIKAPHTPAF